PRPKPPLATPSTALLPHYLLGPDKYTLKTPTLPRSRRHGPHATTVRGVLPTVTYPSHTTLMTGVWPVKHGILNNVTFDPADSDPSWYWYAEDIRVPTLWRAAGQAGYVTGNVSWPVTVGAPGIQFNVPEYCRPPMGADLKLFPAF